MKLSDKLSNIISIVFIIILSIAVVGEFYFLRNFYIRSEELTEKLERYIEREEKEQEIYYGPQKEIKISGNIIKTVFEYPYLVIFEETNYTPNFGGSGVFSLTEVIHAEFEVTEDIKLAFLTDEYKIGDKFPALILNFKINVKNGGTLPQTVRRLATKDKEIIVEEGGEDRIPPPHRDYLYEGHKPYDDFLKTDFVMYEAKLVFPVDEGESYFAFSTGGKSNIRFKVEIKEDEIETEKLD